MSLYKKFKADENCETEGIILDYGDGERIRIARAGGSNKRFQKKLAKVGRQYKNQIRLEMMEEELAREVFIEVYAETVVLGWEGIKDKDGKPLKFTVKNCIQLFTDLPELFRDVQDQAQNFSLFRSELDEADAKN